MQNEIQDPDDIEDIGKYIYERMSADMGITYQDLGAKFGLSADAARGRARRYQEQNKLLAPTVQRRIISSMDEEPHESPEDLWKRALDRQDRTEKRREWKRQRRVIYDGSGPVVGIFMADLHLGNDGTDYRSIDHDFTVINYLANQGVRVFIVTLGDMIDNFIIGRLKDLRMNVSPFLVIEEWGLCDYALAKMQPYLVGGVAGNHDNWSYLLSGVDILREHLGWISENGNRRSSKIMYDPIELAFVLQVGDFEAKVMCRHDWRGHSMYNPTHGIEHAHHTLGREFDVAVGAHTHRGGLAREFANGKDTPGYALICGTYKKEDTHAMIVGYPPPLKTSSVAIVANEDGIAFGTSNLEQLINFVH